MGDFTFDIDKVKGHMSGIEGKFGEFQKVLTAINQLMELNVNNGEDSAVYGVCGAAELSAWSDNASTFGDFYDNFDNWSALVSAAAANNIELSNDVIAMYRTTGNNMDGIKAAREATSADGLDDDALEAYNMKLDPSWASYDDAQAAGFGGEVMTEEEFLKQKNAGNSAFFKYNTYQEYLKDKQRELTGDKTTVEDLAKWTTYEEAQAAGATDVLTKEDFDKKKAAGDKEVSGYDSYRDYLEGKQKEYNAANASAAAEEAVIPDGYKKTDTVTDNDYDGETVTYKNDDGDTITVVKDSEGNIMYTEKTSKDGKTTYTLGDGTETDSKTDAENYANQHKNTGSSTENVSADIKVPDGYEKTSSQENIYKGETIHYKDEDGNVIEVVTDSEGNELYRKTTEDGKATYTLGDGTKTHESHDAVEYAKSHAASPNNNNSSNVPAGYEKTSSQENIYKGETIHYKDEDGNVIEVVTDSEGNELYRKTTEDGKATYTLGDGTKTHESHDAVEYAKSHATSSSSSNQSTDSSQTSDGSGNDTSQAATASSGSESEPEVLEENTYRDINSTEDLRDAAKKGENFKVGEGETFIYDGTEYGQTTYKAENGDRYFTAFDDDGNGQYEYYETDVNGNKVADAKVMPSWRIADENSKPNSEGIGNNNTTWEEN